MTCRIIKQAISSPKVHILWYKWYSKQLPPALYGFPINATVRCPLIYQPVTNSNRLVYSFKICELGQLFGNWAFILMSFIHPLYIVQ